tara:strand:- start:1447 stop:1761 length:315 start_codon:yes stop_codon:yes gene_type:complete
MNKSLALRKKLYLFFSLILFTFIFLYLIYFLIYGDKSIISYFKIKNEYIQYQSELASLKSKNQFYLDRVKRLQTNSIDLDFLDEQLRQKTGIIFNNEVLISIEE